MMTELDLLKEDIPRLEEKFGSKNAFVQMLKAQLALLQRQSIDRPECGSTHHVLLKKDS